MRSNAILLPFLISALGVVRAEDYRLLYEIPHGESMATFNTTFEFVCAIWPPAKFSGLKFQGALVEPGDYSGKNATTEAKIFCTWTNGTTVTPYTTEVAAFLGAKPVSD
ncbi:hypothetical protein B0H11DRAFT_1947750 [Mycena galericulata]|nr:hypothetical protein B0H11DRAFT_1947750 [Mycena galericulata]